MTFKYSICHPDKEKIEYRNTLISGKEVLEIATNYSWFEILKHSESLDQEKVHYNPSLDFTSIQNGNSFCLTANFNKNKDLEFSLWYNRPKKIKLLFGLLGERERMVVDNVFAFSLEDSLIYLECFVNGNYSKIESLYKKNF